LVRGVGFKNVNVPPIEEFSRKVRGPNVLKLEPKETVYEQNLNISFNQKDGGMKDAWGFPMETQSLEIKVPNTQVASESDKNTLDALENVMWITTVTIILAAVYLWVKKYRVSKFYNLVNFMQYCCFM
jgi:hypothetical protein